LNYYVYYKVDRERLAALRALVDSLFKEIEKQSGVRGRWMHRRDDPLTYMEVYEDVKDEKAFEALLEREGAKLGVPRKVERFVCA
jgi:quinol monooxygenase YgiN